MRGIAFVVLRTNCRKLRLFSQRSSDVAGKFGLFNLGKANATAEAQRTPRQEEKSIQYIFYSSYLGVLCASAVAFAFLQNSNELFSIFERRV
jgi:hypothetical protein